MGNYRKLLASATPVLLIIANLALLSWLFGNSRAAVSAKRDSLSLAIVRASQPESPSLPNLKLNVPTLIPGLEQVDPAYAPTLVSDMTILVFSGAGQLRGDYDLYLTSRASVRDPFAIPARINACSSSKFETFPSVSPDGLELLFLRFEPKPKLFHAQRDSIDAEFDSPVPWTVAESLPPGRYPGGAQFIDLQNVQFVTRGKSASEQRQILLATRSAPGHPFAIPVPLPFRQAPVPQFVSTSQLRSYFGASTGLVVAYRRSNAESFSVPTQISDMPGDGPVWVAPKEDVIVFCSPGTRGEMGSRRLWMLRH